MALKKEDIFQKEPSKEESMYDAALSLMKAVGCVERFERKVDALRDAAALFEQLGAYRDAGQRMQDCLDEADEAEEQGCRDIYALGMKKKENASTKSDYIDAIEEFRRLRKYEPYEKKVKQEIKECKHQIQRLETRAAYRRRAVALLVFFLVLLALSRTPAYSVAKGIVYYYRGNYQAAVNCYEEANYLPGVNRLERSAYYKLAKEAEKQGRLKRAMKFYRLAWNYSDAADRTAELECQLIGQAEPGDTVDFGGRRWTVLKNRDGAALLLAKNFLLRKKFDRDGGASWEDSTLRDWLNHAMIDDSYLEQEKAMIMPADEGQDGFGETVFLLSENEYQKYQDLIPVIQRMWWLRDNVIEKGKAKCVSGNQIVRMPMDSKKVVRPAIWISVDA